MDIQTLPIFLYKITGKGCQLSRHSSTESFCACMFLRHQHQECMLSQGFTRTTFQRLEIVHNALRQLIFISYQARRLHSWNEQKIFSILECKIRADKVNNVVTIVEVEITSLGRHQETETWKKRRYGPQTGELERTHRCKVNMIPCVIRGLEDTSKRSGESIEGKDLLK